MNTRKITAMLGLGLSLAVAGCGGEEAAAGESAASAGAATAGAPAAESAAPAAGKVIEVRMITDGTGNRFEPASVTAQRGDIVRFVLDSGVHNVSFPASENANVTGLPAPSPFLQAPGQAHDVAVSFGPGTYRFQCDPHVALGMTGTLTVP